jgi:hypothetical protein
MYSDERNRCSHRLGFPIRKSPDHRLLASSRGLSQLTTSFFASLRQGIHTHALSSLTIKSISNTKYSMSFFLRAASPLMETCVVKTTTTIGKLANTCSKYCPSNIRLSKIRLLRLLEDAENYFSAVAFTSVNDVRTTTFGFFVLLYSVLVGLDRLELSTSPLSGVRSSHLSYRPKPRPLPAALARSFAYRATGPERLRHGGAGRDRTGDLLNANQALSQLSYSPKKFKSRPIGCKGSRYQTDYHSNYFNKL